MAESATRARPVRRTPRNLASGSEHSLCITVRVARTGEGRDVALDAREPPVWWETLDDARRVVYVCGAHGRRCEPRGRLAVSYSGGAAPGDVAVALADLSDEPARF